MDRALVSTFRAWVTRTLANNPDLEHEVRDSGSSIRLTFPKRAVTGFDVSIEVSEKVVSIETDRGWHLHERDPSEQDLAHLFGLVRDMLSPNMRMRERHAGGRAYRWDLEAYDGSRWRADGTTGLLFWNYFGKRTASVFQNEMLPARPMGTGEGT